MDENDDTSFPYENFRLSALYKACSLTPSVNNVTLGPKSPTNETETEKNIDVEITEPISDKKRSKGKDKFLKRGLIKDSPKVEMNLVKKALADMEECRLLSVQDVMRERIQNWQEYEELVHKRLVEFLEYSKQEYLANKIISEQKILNDIQELEIKNKYKREAIETEKNIINAQRLLERNQKVKQAEDEAKQKSELIMEKKRKLDLLFEYQKLYKKEYVFLLESLKNCQDKSLVNKIASAKAEELKSCGAELDQIFKKCKFSEVTDENILQTEKLVKRVQSIVQYLDSEIQSANEQFAAKSKLENKNVEVKTDVEQIERKAKPTDLSDCFTHQSLQLFTQMTTYLIEHQKSYENIINDNASKKFRFNCQKAINIPVNAISPINSSHLHDKYMKLHRLLQGQVVDVGDLKISASQHPQGIAFCKNILAKKFVRQGDLTVSSKPDAAFSIASVLVNLWVDFPDFGQLVLAHFYSHCPYLAPVFMPQVEGQSDEAYYRSLGYQYSPNGEVEKQDKFLKRMSGITRLYSAVLISHVRQQDKKNPLGMSEAWRWLSSILNLDPRPDICATVLYDFLDVTANQLFLTYNQQFKKVLVYICQEYFPKLEQVTPHSSGGPLVRLEQFLQKILKQESVPPPPDGLLPPNFW